MITFAEILKVPDMSTKEKPNYLWSLLSMRCPRCRSGKMFTESNPWNLKKTLRMPKTCPECGQPFELEVGFWYGTGYVSYAISIALSVSTFIAWWLLVGITSIERLVFWLVANAVFLILLQPWLMRLIRVIYLYFFVNYDPEYKTNQVRTFDYESEDFFRKD
jgi:hypothetical protein